MQLCKMKNIKAIIFDLGAVILNINYKNSRLISGDILSGKQVGPDNYIDFYSNTFCAIPEGDKHRFFGWIPFVDNFIPSMHKTSLSWIKSNKKKYNICN